MESHHKDSEPDVCVCVRVSVFWQHADHVVVIKSTFCLRQKGDFERRGEELTGKMTQARGGYRLKQERDIKWKEAGGLEE